MAKYRDTVGETHELRINLNHRDRIRDATEWDLLRLAHEPDQIDGFIRAVQEDNDLRWVIIAEIERKDAQQLKELADGTVNDDALAALLDAVGDFFQTSSPLKTAYQALLEHTRKAQRETTAVIAQQIAQTLLASHTNLAGLSAAVPMSG